MVDIEEDIRSLQLDSAGNPLAYWFLRFYSFLLLSMILCHFILIFSIQYWLWICGIAEDNNGVVNPEDGKPEEVEKYDKMDEGWL